MPIRPEGIPLGKGCLGHGEMTDIEVVALSLTAEYMSIDSENALFKQLKGVPIRRIPLE